MTSYLSLFVVGIMYTFGIAVLVHGQSTEPGEAGACVMTETSCPCAQMQGPGTCVKHKGNNMCSMEACTPSYRCDCLGYEMCKRSPCSIYSKNKDVVPSGTDLFGCHLILIDSNAVCTTFDHVMDTTEAVENMYTAIISANDEAYTLAMEAYETVAAIESDIIAVNDALRNIESSRNQMTQQEKDDIEKQAEAVISSVADSGQLALKASHEAEKVYQASRDVAELRDDIKKADVRAKTVKQTLNEAQKRAERSNEKCTQCDSPKAELEGIEKVRKEAVLKAADISRKSREYNGNAGGYHDKVLEHRSRAQEGKQNLLSKIEEIKKRVINVNI